MTISSTLNRIATVGNGATTAYPVTFPFHAQTDLIVLSTVITTGVTTTKALTTDYTISGTPDALGHYINGGSVNFLVAPASTVRITIYRDPARTQALDLQDLSIFPAESMEAQLDYVTMLVQRVSDLMGRSLRQSDGDSSSIGQLPAAISRPSMYLGFDTNGDPVALASTTSQQVLLTDTSVTSLAIGTGSKTFTVSSGKNFTPGQFIAAVSAANNANYMHGTVTSYSGTTLVINVTNIGGSGTLADWRISISGSQGTTGATGAAGTAVVPIAAAAGTADAITANYTPDITLSDQQLVAFVASAANTTTTPTFAPDGLTARTITKKGGVALAPGDIPGALAVCLIEYNIANTRWELLNPACNPPAVLMTPVASTSGTSKDFTGIPAGVKRITLTLSAVSTNGSSIIIVQLGTGGSPEATNYLGAVDQGVGGSNYSTGFLLSTANSAANVFYGQIVFTLQDTSTNTWIGMGMMGLSNTAQAHSTAGSKALAGVLNMLRVTMVNGTDAFDAGKLNVFYEF